MILDFSDIKKLHSKKITFVIGTFDLLHSGHLFFLNKVKNIDKEGKLLIGVISDSIASKAKGKNRPIISAEQRAEMLSNLKIVDYVFIAPELPTGDVANIVLNSIKPKFSAVTKSAWQNRINPQETKNTQLVIINDEIGGISTSKIIEKIKNG